MALVRFPEGQQRSGSTGGAVFSHNRYGPYIRARSVPVNPQTTRQNVVRARLTDLSTYWRETLSQGQRDAWDQYADETSMPNAFGESINLTGLNHFLRSNQAVLEVGATLIATAPGIPGLAPAPANPVLSCSVATGNVSLAWTADPLCPWDTNDAWYILVYLGSPVAPSRKFFGGPFRYQMNVAGADPVPPTSPQTSAFVFTLQEGQRCFWYMRVLDELGRLSPAVQKTFLVAA